MRKILPVIVMAQFFCTSVWFAGNSILPDIIKDLHLKSIFLIHLTSAVQVGFIAGTLVFAVFAISDRFSPSFVFFVSSMLAGLFNLGITIPGISPANILGSRFFTGFFLAGIYPVGMKIASDYYREELSKSLGLLVGALVIGTASPHLIKYMAFHFPYRYVIYATTILSVTGGLFILLFVPDGPYRNASQKLSISAFMKGFSKPAFRSVSFGYFGHMWELYSFWLFVPAMLSAHDSFNPGSYLNVSFFSFLVIAAGGIGCVFSGMISKYFGEKKVARACLFVSCCCCLFSPLFLSSHSAILVTSFLFVWGFTVVADSPLFSTLVARHAPAESRGSSLTIINCIGFSITILSIQLLNTFSSIVKPPYIYMLLALGPVLGLLALVERDNK